MTELKMWPTMFYVASIPDAEKLNQEMLKACYRLLDRGKQWGVTPDLKVGIFESPPELFQEPEAVALMNFIVDLIKKNLLPLDKKLKGIFFESWCHIANDGGYHDVHTHKTVQEGICGCYCVQAGQASEKNANGVLRFYNHSDVSKNQEVMTYVPLDGEMIFFPGHVPHGAMPYKGKDDRVIIAFNAHFQF